MTRGTVNKIEYFWCLLWLISSIIHSKSYYLIVFVESYLSTLIWLPQPISFGYPRNQPRQADNQGSESVCGSFPEGSLIISLSIRPSVGAGVLFMGERLDSLATGRSHTNRIFPSYGRPLMGFPVWYHGLSYWYDPSAARQYYRDSRYSKG